MDILKSLGLDAALAELDRIGREIEALAARDPYEGCPPLVRMLMDTNDDTLITRLAAAIDQGADPEARAPDGTSLAGRALQLGRRDILGLLRDRGADFGRFGWTALHGAVVFGDAGDVKAALCPDVATSDADGLSPFLLACTLGRMDCAAVLLPKTPDHARVSSEHAAEPALTLVVQAGLSGMVIWLLAQGFDVNARDAYGGTALIEAVERNDLTIAALLLEGGADPALGRNLSQALAARKPSVWTSPFAAFGAKMADAISGAGFLADTPDTMTTAANAAHSDEMVRLLVRAGASPADFDAEQFPVAIGADLILPQQVNPAMFPTQRTARIGDNNPERVTVPFWLEQMRTGHSGFSGARAVLGEEEDLRKPGRPDPIWSFQRFGRSVTRLPDGRWCAIAGEHEDSYDADFCIYADVTVFDGNGGVEHFIYSDEDFPPTDFHTATLVGDAIWLIGNLGYVQQRGGATQVLRLHLADFSIQRMETEGDGPGWIHRHRAVLDGSRIIISGGKIEPGFRDQTGVWVLDLATLAWSRMGQA